jgi:hypothetical protein
MHNLVFVLSKFGLIFYTIFQEIGANVLIKMSRNKNNSHLVKFYKVTKFRDNPNYDVVQEPSVKRHHSRCPTPHQTLLSTNFPAFNHDIALYIKKHHEFFYFFERY